MLKRFLFMSLMLGSLCVFSGCKSVNLGDAVGAGSDLMQAATLTDAEVQQLGADTAKQMDATNKIAANNNAYAKRLNKIVSGLKNEDGLQLNYKVYLTSDVNAFALPDGSIRVYSGLMDLMNDDEIYFVIGHEIGHVKNGDTKDRFRMAYATSAARKGASAAGGVAAAISASELGAIGEAFINAQFSQSQETAADEYGLQLMKKYKKNTGAAVTALRKLAGPGEKSSMFSTHPDSSARADKLESLRNK